MVVGPTEEEEEGEVAQTSTRHLWSVINAINLDIFGRVLNQSLTVSFIRKGAARRHPHQVFVSCLISHSLFKSITINAT